MNILDKINSILLSEGTIPCKMFWCIPSPSDDGIDWNVLVVDSEGDDLSNWMIVLHKLRHAWKRDFESCRECPGALPRGICADNVLYHGNNLPMGVYLDDVANEMGCKLGAEVNPRYHNKYGINNADLETLENVIGEPLGLEITQI